MEEVDVVVIGAGIAGLACGRTLLASGHSVAVLEARDRVGGRLWQREIGGAMVETGGTFLHGKESNLLHGLALELGIETVFVDWDGEECPEHVVTMREGKELKGRQLKELDRMSDKLLEIIFSKKRRKKAVRDARGSVPSNAALSLLEEVMIEMVEEESFKRGSLQWIDREFFVRHLFYSNISCDYGHSVDSMSLLEFDGEEETLGGNHLMRAPGYSGIIQHLLQGGSGEEPLDVRMSHVVTSVQRLDDAERVLIQVSQGTQFLAKNVVVTVPLHATSDTPKGVLKAGRISFLPELSKRKQATLERMSLAVINKVFLHFDHVWWKGSAYLYENANEATGTSFSGFYDMHRINGPHSPAVLATFVAGNAAIRMEDMTDEEVASAAMEAVREMWGSEKDCTIPKPVSCMVSRWGKDEYSLGSYSITKPGSSFRDHDDLALPEWGSRLRFAGEATYREYPSTTHGAYLSGVREAQRIAKSISHAK